MTFKNTAKLIFLGAICVCIVSDHPLPVAAQGDSDALPDRFLYDKDVRPGPSFITPDGDDRFLYDAVPREPRFVVPGGRVRIPVHSLEPASDVRLKLVGQWKLVSYESMDAAGNRVKRDMTGRLHYDATGNMSVQLYPVGEHKDNIAPGYLGYFGTYTVDPDVGFINYRVDGSNIVDWVGANLVRYYYFLDGALILSLRRNGRVTESQTWERL